MVNKWPHQLVWGKFLPYYIHSSYGLFPICYHVLSTTRSLKGRIFANTTKVVSSSVVFQVEELFSLKDNGTNVETRLVNQHLYKALKGSDFHILEITRMKMNEFRADAHPSIAGGKKHDDCMHWCLPGTTDTWNDLFITHLNNIKFQNWDSYHPQIAFSY